MSGHRLSALDAETLNEEQRRTYEAAHAGRGGTALIGGRIAGPLLAWLHAPVVGNAQQALGAVLRFQLTLSPRICEIAILSAAYDASAEFQIVAHERMAYDAGMRLDQIEALRAGREPEFDDPTERIAWRTANRIIKTGNVDDEEYAEAVGALGEEGMVELVTLIGYYRLLASQMRVFGVPVEDYRGPRVPERE
jgi:4-carboxymuconolactone decarboxylase